MIYNKTLTEAGSADHPFRVRKKCTILSLVWLAAVSVVTLSTNQGVAESGQSLRTERLGQLANPGLPLSNARGEAAESYASPWVHSQQGDVRLVSTVTGVGTATSIRLGLQFNLLPHWKIYWRTPGDAGYPPTIDWSGSQNLAGTIFTWPVPQRFSLQGIETAGYEEEVVFPITATLVQPGSPLLVRAKVNFLACAEICIPQAIKLELPVLDGLAEPSPFMQLVERYVARVPGDGKAVGLRLLAAATRPEDSAGKEGGFIEVRVEANPPLTAPKLFIESLEGLHAGTPQVLWSEDSQQITLQVPTRVLVAVGVPVTLTIVDGVRFLEATVTLTTATVVRTFVKTSTGLDTVKTLAVMLSLAFLGGLILNLMPCVLPILSLKVLILINHGRDKRVVRWNFVASAAGILCSFLLLAVTAMMVKAGGAAVGWGIQFQQPLFLTVMVIVLTMFAANLWGLFELTLPSWLADRCSRPHEHSYIGAFLTGAFATLLATPCSAPFLSTAVGFALARGSLEILLIFTGLGIGMALPYLLMAIFPVLAAWLPRPGRWMLYLKWFMGFTLAATVVWLLTVLRAQVGEVAAILTGTAMVGIMGTLILRRSLPLQWRPIVPIAAMLSTFLIVAVEASYPRQALEVVVAHNSPQDLWLPFDENAIKRHVAEGRVVFVDITADWCVTCQVNKMVVLSRGEVAARLHAVVAIRADWTRPDAKITAYMARFGRYGIPFDAVYGPGAPQGLLLPELLTKEAVLQALNIATGEVS